MDLMEWKMDMSKAFDSYCNCFLGKLTQLAERGFELVQSHLTPSRWVKPNFLQWPMEALRSPGLFYL